MYYEGIDFSKMDPNLILFCENFQMKYIREKARDIELLSKEKNINIKVYSIVAKKKYKIIEKENHFKTDNNSETLLLLQSGNKWARILKPKRVLNKVYCYTCCQWINFKSVKDFKDTHSSLCKRCICGFFSKDLTEHQLTCKETLNWKERLLKKRKQKEDIYTIIPSKNHKKRNSKIYHADLECFTYKDKFETYACGLKEPFTNFVEITYGEDSLKRFMNKLYTLEGVLWFFCGSRFDCFFLLKYCIINNLKIDPTRTLLNQSQVMTLSLCTKGGKKRLEIKDLGRFLPGSLAFNCQALGIEESSSKSNFNHSKIKTWKDVWTHEKEVREYLRLDVVAQSAVYDAMSNNIWDDYKIDMSKFISLAQMSFTISTINTELGLFKRIDKKYESDLREAYKGGRLVLTWPFWKVKNYDTWIDKISKGENITEMFEKQDEYLCYFDKNSLYPSVMFSELYPCGNMSKVEITNENQKKQAISDILREAEYERNGTYTLVGEDKNLKLIFTNEKANWEWKYRVIQVDLLCPQDIYIAFVMDRNEKGFNIQNLLPKEKLWITGGELLEAVIIGYKITNVYAFYEWERREYLFRDFIDIANKRKSEAKKGTAQYLIPKNMMNSNSGKHAQKSITKKVILNIGNDISKIDIYCHDIENIYNEKGELVAYYQEVEDIKKTTPYPLQLSVFILGNSRVSMSRFTRLIDGYSNNNNVPIYGDTDSLVITKQSIANIDPIQFGPYLGQMKDEMPKSKIIAQITLAPKTNMKLYIDNDAKAYTIFTSKGIPHIREPYEINKTYFVSREKEKEALEIANFLSSRDSTKSHFQHVTLGEPLFVKTYLDLMVFKEVKDRLTWKDVEELLQEPPIVEIICLFGGMVRKLKPGADLDEMGIYLDYLRRNLKAESWWKKPHTRKTTINFPNELTKPL